MWPLTARLPTADFIVCALIIANCVWICGANRASDDAQYHSISNNATHGVGSQHPPVAASSRQQLPAAASSRQQPPKASSNSSSSSSSSSSNNGTQQVLAVHARGSAQRSKGGGRRPRHSAGETLQVGEVDNVADVDGVSSCAGLKTAKVGSEVWCQCYDRWNKVMTESGCKHKKACQWDGVKCHAWISASKSAPQSVMGQSTLLEEKQSGRRGKGLHDANERLDDADKANHNGFGHIEKHSVQGKEQHRHRGEDSKRDNDHDLDHEEDIEGLNEAMQLFDDPAPNAKPTPEPPWPSMWKAAPAYMAVNMLAVGACTLSMLYYMSAWPFSLLLPEPASIVDRVQGYALSDRFFGNFIYSIVLPDSFGLSALLSESATFSGWIIGIYKGLSLLGLAFSLLLCSVHNKRWIRNIYPCMVTGKVMAFVGNFMFLIVVAYRDHIPHAKNWILASRAIAGTGYGIGMIPVELIFVHTTTSDQRPVMLSAAVFNVTLGIGLGPLFASVTRKFYESMTGTPEGALEAVMCLPLVASAVCLVSIFYVERGETYIKEPEADAAGSTEVQRPEFVERSDFMPRRVGIIACAFVVGIRAAICAGLEAATAMILERDYAWDRSTVGIAIGLSFLGAVPGRVLFMYLKDRLSIIDTIRYNMLASFIASIFLFKTVQNVLTMDNGGSALGLLIAGSILYCAIYQVSGLIEGIMTTFALPTGSYFTVDNVILLKLIMLDSIGRTFGPPLARMLVEAGGKESGQDCYAWQQMAMTLAATLLTEAVLLRSMDAIRARRAELNKAELGARRTSAESDNEPLTGGLLNKSDLSKLAFQGFSTPPLTFAPTPSLPPIAEHGALGDPPAKGTGEAIADDTDNTDA